MLEGKNVIITGCLQGIGKETMAVFAQNRANIIACSYRQDEEFAGFCEQMAKENNIEILPVYFDMNDNEAVKNAAKQIISWKKEIHGLVNIAGMNRDAYFNMLSYQDLYDTFQVNFFAQILFTQYIVRWMQRKKTKGSIVFTSSIAALVGAEGQVAYGASKAALIGAMRSMAIELGKDGIRVNAVAPGVIHSPMTQQLDDALICDRVMKMDIPRLGNVDEVSNLYMFLVSDLASHITGQVMRIDGGM
ncbi:MAG: SDR family oxidoreductase [Lachnospiraceae bacterium]|jgi:3-oxoacyl-[acyl-carrier protein] reductase|nr:SDR family oxidoreductase [Lachnospiraceae bacterium]